MSNSERPQGTILWADDEIDTLKPHQLFLQQKGFLVTPVSNGADALELLKTRHFDLVFLDEHMPGLSGLDVLNRIKADYPSVPVVMVTRSEEEQIMNEAIGSKIADYLIKPVNPSQILLTVKRLLERYKLRNEHSSQKYLQRFNQISMAIQGGLNPDEWIEIYRELTRWEMELQDADEGLQSVLQDQFQQVNLEFCRYIEKDYRFWLREEAPKRPLLSPDVVREFVAPQIDLERPLFFIVIDCMRYDQWLAFQGLLAPHFAIDTKFYYSILPTATPYSRNAIFAGLYPSEIERLYPNLWETADEDETSLNKFEDKLLELQLRRLGYPIIPKYTKVLQSHDARRVLDQLHTYMHSPVNAFVFNFVDTLVHSRSDTPVLREIAPDVSAFRSLTRTWFEHSDLYAMLKELSERNVKVVITTDHGSVRTLRDAQVQADRSTSTSLRYKYGRSLGVDNGEAILVKNPAEYKLPNNRFCPNYIFAKEDFYFVYPNNYHKFQNKYKDTFQHGGVSMEEMILPVLTLTPKRG
jgi:CheY-like chemotaxis protein